MRAVAIACVLAACGADRPAAEEPEPSPTETPVATDVPTFEDCNSGPEFLAYWETIDDAQRSQLAASDDTTMALTARWEIERRVIEGSPGHLDRAGIDRFVAFVRERLGIDPPAWWIEALASAVVYAETRTTAYLGVNNEDYRPTSAGVETRASLAVIGDGDRVRLEAANLTAMVPGNALTIDRRPTSHLEAHVAAERAIVIAFDSGAGGFPYAVRSFEGGAERWSREVCGGGRQVLGGLGIQALAIVPRADDVVIFGAETHAVYLDIVAVQDGVYLARWNSDLWFARGT
jgi:hypothetical protein